MAAKESLKQKRARTKRIVTLLQEHYSDADCALHHDSALQLLVATILSAQCTDVRVNQVTPALFERFPTAQDYADATLEEVEELIRTTGFFRNKAKSLVGLGRALIEDHDGEVPQPMEQLIKLPGVGRKTANVIRGTWFGLSGITVDTHVKRLSHRLGWTTLTDPVKIEYALQEILDEEDWTFASHAIIWHGREICNARKPACGRCALRPECPYSKG
jgi:endonuclease-3